MLSPHEIATLLLVERAPHQVELSGQHTARLAQEALVEIGTLPAGEQFPRLTSKGRDMLKRLDVLAKQRAIETESSE